MSYLVEDYPAIFQSNSFGVLIIGQQDEVIDFNSMAGEIFALSKNQKLPLADLINIKFDPKKPSLTEGRHHGTNLNGKIIAVDYTQISSDHHSYSSYILVTETPENSLKEEDFAITIINSMPGQFYLFNEKGEMLLWNHQMSTMSGYSDEEIKSMGAMSFFPEDEHELVSSKIQEVYALGESQVQAHLLTKSGNKIPQKVSGKRIVYKGQNCVVGLSTDISDLVDIQDSLKSSTKLLKTAQEIAQIGYWEWNWYDEKYYWSDEMYELCGRDKKDGPMPHLEFASRIHRKDLEVLEKERKRIIKTLEPGEAEFRFFTPNNELRYFTVHTSPILDEKGKFCSLEGTIQNITERKKQEEIVRNSNDRYELISKATNDAVWDWDIRSNTITGNENYIKLFDIKNKEVELTDEMFFTRIHPEDRERVRTNMAEALFDNKSTVTEEYRFLNHEEEYRVILDRSQIIYDEQRMPIRMVGAMQDITLQKNAEDELQDITNRLSLATTSAKLGIFDWNLQTDQLDWNEYMYEIFDVDPSDFDKKFQSWLDCLHPRDVHNFDLINNQDLLKKRLLHTHVRVVPFSEEIRYIEIHAIILPDKDRNVYSVIGVCRDISDKVLAEQSINRAIINTQENERFEIGRELHDNAIQVLIAALMNLNYVKERSPDPTAAETSIELTKRAINEIRRLSHQLAPSDLGYLAIEESIKDLLKEMNYNEEFETNLEIDIQPDAYIPNEVKMNLYRIVQEQLSNIHKHSKASHIHIELAVRRMILVLKTRDNGIGFDPKTSLKGIGISNMERRVKMFEGDIEINSSPKNGCEIVIQIPLESMDF